MTQNNKQDFIQMISRMSPEDITQFIKDKGKKPKLVKPFIKVYDIKESNSTEDMRSSL